MSGTTLCPRCGAPIPWDGSTKTVNCPYCQIVVTPSVFNTPPPNIPAMRSGGAGAGLGVGCVVAIAVSVLVLLMGAGAAIVLFRSSPSPATITISTPTIPAIPAVASTISAASAPLLSFGETGNGAGQLSDARSIAVDMDENVYVADYDTLRVQKFDQTGKFQWITSVSKDEFAGNKQIFQIACDTKNVLWVARTGALLKLQTTDGKTVGTIKGNYDTLWFKWIALDPVGNIATTHDAAGDTDLLLLDPNGKLKKRVKNKTVDGLAFDGAGNVYVTASMDGAIEVVDAQGNVKSKFGSRSDKHTAGAASIAIDGKGHLFVSTHEGIDVFDSGGGFIKTMSGPRGSVRALAVSAKNNLFYLDNDKVTKIAIGTLS